MTKLALLLGTVAVWAIGVDLIVSLSAAHPCGDGPDASLYTAPCADRPDSAPCVRAIDYEQPHCPWVHGQSFTTWNTSTRRWECDKDAYDHEKGLNPPGNSIEVTIVDADVRVVYSDAGLPRPADPLAITLSDMSVRCNSEGIKQALREVLADRDGGLR